jgi:hypothetical protein
LTRSKKKEIADKCILFSAISTGAGQGVYRVED